MDSDTKDSSTRKPIPNNLLRHQREKRGWSQRKVAELLGTDEAKVSRWEKGGRNPSPYYREKFIALYGASAAELGFIDQEGIAILHPRREDWGEAPHTGPFYGRNRELVEGKQWILDDHCRVAAILGMGGIGKTSLAVMLVDNIKEEFDYIYWCSLQNAPPLQNILHDCIKFVSDQQRTDLPEAVDSQISLLVKYLQERRCLLVLDNFETLLQAGKDTGSYREGYEGYGRLLQRIGEVKHQSCLLLTSREKPKEIALLEGNLSTVHSSQLRGVGLRDGQAILRDKRVYGTEETWEKLIQHYAGNPLALKLVCQFIWEVFDGDIATFLKEGEKLLSDIRDILDQQFERLSALEQELIYWLAIERESVSLKDIQENIVHPLSTRALQEALRSLRRRDLIEARKSSFTLQNVVMEYVTDRFVDQVCEEITTGAIALLERFALMKAHAKDYIRESQIRLILLPIAQRLLLELGRDGLERRSKSLLARLREIPPPQSGYAAGNVLNLLVQLGCDLRGCDFSQLVVRQAYLQGVTLPDVNFSYANLALSVFTSTFGSILSVSFSPRGELLAAGTTSGDVWIWLAQNSTPFLICQGHNDWVRSVAFSPDGKVLASGGDDQTIRLWEVSTGHCLKVLRGHTHWVRSVAFSPDGKMLVSGSDDQTIRLWDVNSDQCLYTFQEHAGKVKSVAFSPDGKVLVSGSIDQTVRLWEVSSGQCLKTLEHDSWVWCVAFSPDGNTVTSGSDDQAIRLWEVSTGQCLTTLQGHSNRIWSVAFSPDGKVLASGSEDRTIRLWEMSTGRCLAALQGHTNMIWSVAFSPDGNMLASGGDDQSARLWEVSTGQCLATLQGYANWTNTVDCSPAGDILASGGDDKLVRLWEVDTGRCLATLQGHTNRIRAVAFSPDKTILASAGDDQNICFWEVNTEQPLNTLQGHTNWINSIAFSPEGRILASGGEDWTARLWEVNTGDCFATLREHTGRIRSVAFSPNGKVLASGSEDRTIRLWEVSTGRCFATLQGQANVIWSVAFSPDGSILASGEDNHSICLWEVSTGRCFATLQGQANVIWSVAFSPDGKVLASSGTDRSIQLWDVNTGRCLTTLETPCVARSVVFTPDGKTLASGNSDGTTRLWKIQTGICFKTLRSDRPYERMNITGIRGITEAQREALKALGAIEMQERQAEHTLLHEHRPFLDLPLGMGE